MTWREFELSSQGHHRSMEIKRELNMEAWRQARLMAYYAAAPMLDKHTSITNFFPLPGDKVIDPKTSADEAKARIQEYLEKGWLKATA